MANTLNHNRLPRRKSKWQLQRAKAEFSRLVDVVQEEGAQTITKNGKEVAVLLSKEEYDRIARPKESLVEFFKKAPHPEVKLDIERSRETLRDIDL